MRMTFKGGKLDGDISAPPSKSHTHRAFFLASLASGRSVIECPLLSDDTHSTLNACRSMGAEIMMGEKITIRGGVLHAPTGTVDTGNSGTTMRIFTGLSSMFDSEVVIDGDDSLRKRPMGPLLNALSSMGVGCGSDDGKPPVRITGPNNGGKVSIRGDISSQFISSLMMTAPMLHNDTEITIIGELLSEPYVEMTFSMMRAFGADVDRNGNVFRIRGNTGYKSHDYVVPGDFSSAAFPMVAGALGGRVTVTGLNLSDIQGDREIIEIVKRAGADVSIGNDSVTVCKKDLIGIDADLGNIPDLFPIVAVLLSTAKGTSRLYGAPQLRFKESDRIESTVAMLKTLGADIEGTDDGCVIHGRPELIGGVIDNRNDHRIMMAAAVASLVCREGVEMENAECSSISYPGFIEKMGSIGLRTGE